MDVSVHGIKKVTVEKTWVYGGFNGRTICVDSRGGKVLINLYAETAAQLEIVQVDDLYEPEPAA